MHKFLIVLLSSLLTFAPLSFAGPEGDYNEIEELLQVNRELQVDNYDYPRLFKVAGRIMSRPKIKAFLTNIFEGRLVINDDIREKFHLPQALDELPESLFVVILRKNPQLLPLIEEFIENVPRDATETDEAKVFRKQFKSDFKKIAKGLGILKKFNKDGDAVRPVALFMHGGQPGYTSIKMLVNHPRLYPDGRVKRADDFIKRIIKFIDSAKKEIALNVYEFDIESIADALIRAHKRGVAVRLGFDKNAMEHHENRMTLYHKLRAYQSNGSSKKALFKVELIDSVGLNHQKIMTRDWSIKKASEVIFSSGNFTYSGISPLGDLAVNNFSHNSSKPNANNMLVIKSWALANLVNHELTKTIDLKLRGKASKTGYPLSGTYLIKGPKEGSYIIVAFSPNGGLGDINNHIIARTIRHTQGPVKMLQFSASSEDVLEALKDRIKKEQDLGQRYDFRALGDISSLTQKWSLFLKKAGYTRLSKAESKKQLVQFVDADENDFRRLLGEAEFEDLRDNIRSPSEKYGMSYIKGPLGKSHLISVKLHHKAIVTGRAFVTGSFNFSESAETNQEQIMVVVDEDIVKQAHAMFDGLWRETSRENSITALVRERAHKIKLKFDKEYKKLFKSGALSCGLLFQGIR